MKDRIREVMKLIVDGAKPEEIRAKAMAAKVDMSQEAQDRLEASAFLDMLIWTFVPDADWSSAIPWKKRASV